VEGAAYKLKPSPARPEPRPNSSVDFLILQTSPSLAPRLLTWAVTNIHERHNQKRQTVSTKGDESSLRELGRNPYDVYHNRTETATSKYIRGVKIPENMLEDICSKSSDTTKNK
jgi:hypothetical protein